MIPINKFRYQEVIILGLGRSGLPALHSLLCGKAKVIAIDDNLQNVNIGGLAGMLHQQAISERNLIVNPAIDQINFKNISAVIISPGVPLTYPKPHTIIEKAKQLNIPITSDIELLYETCTKSKYIAITGTNGKSTTTALTGHILKYAKQVVQVGGNIGVGALQLEPLDSDGIYVLETSSFQLELLNKVKFDIAVFLNLTPDHLDRHGDFDSYKAAKLKIFENQKSDDYAIVSIDTLEMQKIFDYLAKYGKQKIVPLSIQKITENGVSIIDGVIYDNITPGVQKEFKIKELKRLPGEHNAQNIAAAYAATKINGVKEEIIVEAIKSFKGLEHRIELVLEKGELKFINDSKGTNTDATQNALKAFNNIYWIAGGVSKDQGIECLSHLFDRLKHVYLIGAAAPKFAEVLKKYNKPYTCADTLKRSLELIKESNINSGVVLLSPACASLDQWKDYEQRGNSFKEMVKEMWND
ncbi:UDP-N-acetylmuramoyl-L-alanyl-D-glutamate synthetase [endosymbiont of Acanthamoeba sp. UWC8]|uniref:UDP-N-acetylmuramoyl-L-alanine--D-glutamate ligase n=1 Tax=endosymbiont of Acanthamoeba sp. UWC8 TaxID=86106 RepID=UPI0004D156A0|nr:UDP-N-acetylmuramoyl-L-alanine--D-glutamate ligase [endosymbiont of Acanthamoeba sp. UWC8]AIF81987.1 UDP-N-acetylmuramoyl-L-alanyl-D-glutamate synthetase [endosymbiont of Acanthamoeba sp. UWC8]